MKHILPVAALTLAAMSLAPQPASASGNSPWCANITLGEDAFYEDCRYNSFEECRPNVLAGNRGFCNVNPAYVGPTKRVAKARAHKKRRISRD